MKIQLKYPALTLAAALAGALSLASTASANPLDPADPYDYTAGQFPALQQNLGLPPQYCGQESIGMRQARFAGGQGTTTTVSAVNNGAVAMVTTTTVPTNSAIANPEVGTMVASNANPSSPVMLAIRSSLTTIGNTKGATAEADSSDIAGSFNNAPYDSHQMLAVYQLRVNQTSARIDQLGARAAQFAGDSQTRYNTALQDVQASRAKLDQDFAAAQNATPDNWPQVRSSLATDYQAYSDAVARAEAAANNRAS